MCYSIIWYFDIDLEVEYFVGNNAANALQLVFGDRHFELQTYFIIRDLRHAREAIVIKEILQHSSRLSICRQFAQMMHGSNPLPSVFISLSELSFITQIVCVFHIVDDSNNG